MSFLTESYRPVRRAWLKVSAGLPGRRYLEMSIFPLCVLIAWQATYMNGWISPIVLPGPGEVVRTLRELWSSGELISHLGISASRVVFGFGLGAGLGIALGFAMGISRTAEQIVYPTFRAIVQVPTLAWLPLLMMVFGIGEALKIIIITKSVMVPLCINSFEGIRGIPEKYFEVARVLRLRRSTVLFRLALPAVLPPTFSGARQGLSSAWVSLVGVELLASMEGIGYMMNYGRTIFQLDVVLAGVVVIGIVGLLMDFTMGRLEARMSKWRIESEVSQQ